MLYTVEEANAALAHIGPIVGDLVREFLELRRIGRQRRALMDGESDYDKALKARIDLKSARIESFIKELNQIGCKIRDLEIGLVDIPYACLSDSGRPMCLSWKLGERGISHWIDPGGFRERAPLPRADTT